MNVREIVIAHLKSMRRLHCRLQRQSAEIYIPAESNPRNEEETHL